MTEPALRRWRLLGRAECGLCEELAQAVFEHHGPGVALDWVDVDADATLQRRYGLRVPVLLDEWGEVIAEGRYEP